MDYRKNKLPCKHICAVVSLPDVGWQSLGASFNNHLLLKLDETVVAKPINAQSSTFQTTDNIHHDDVLDNHCDVHDNNDYVLDNDDDFDDDNTFHDRKGANREQMRAPPTNVPVGLNKRKQNKNNRAKIIATLKALHDELYIVNDKQVLAKLGDMINEALLYARVNHPAENHLPLKDKTLSPRKGKKRKANNLPPSSSDRSSLCLRGKKVKKKRYGIGADKREKASNLTILSNGSIKRTEKETKKPCTIDLTNIENIDKLEDKTPHWLTVECINLTSKSQAVLINHDSWLGDDHMDAAQRLLKKQNPAIGGLNDIVLMTYFQRGKLKIATNAGLTIQCYNIGGHWVVSSSSKGCVTVYESLSTGLNKTLLQQLAHLYQLLCAEGQLTITVVLQQLQKGSSDCGLFCIANATALAHGINPTSVTWDQSKMRKHVAQCFLNHQLVVFPHEVSHLGKQTKVYKLKIKS